MTAGVTAVPADPLAPARTALLDEARKDAGDLLADADAAAAATVAAAREEADAILAEARARGVADGAILLAAERARTARDARAVVLAERRAAYDRLRLQARDAVSDLRLEPSYSHLLEALRARARRDLGSGASVREQKRGGIVAESGGRRVEYTLDALADTIIERLGDDLGELWAP